MNIFIINIFLLKKKCTELYHIKQHFVKTVCIILNNTLLKLSVFLDFTTALKIIFKTKIHTHTYKKNVTDMTAFLCERTRCTNLCSSLTVSIL